MVKLIYTYNLILFMGEKIITSIVSILQLLIGFGLINVWLLRFNHATKYRGENARNMKEEFSIYGLPSWSLYIVGFLKITIAAIVVLTTIFSSVSFLILPALIILCVLMVGAISMHIKVHDPFIKILPAILMLSMSIVVLYITALL